MTGDEWIEGPSFKLLDVDPAFRDLAFGGIDPNDIPRPQLVLDAADRSVVSDDYTITVQEDGRLSIELHSFVMTPKTS